MNFNTIKQKLLDLLAVSPLLTGLLVFVLSLAIAWYITYAGVQIGKLNEREEVSLLLREYENQFNFALNDGVSAVKTLAFLSEKYDIRESFDQIGKEILESNPKVDVIQLLDSGAITHVYPMSGNESVIGYDILKDPDKRAEAEEAIDRKEVYFAGPIELKQGGQAIIGRLPIFEDEKFIGFAAAIIYFDKLVESVIESNPNGQSYFYQLSKENPQTGETENFISNLNPETGKKGYQADTFLEQGNWILSVQAAPRGLNPNFWMSVILRILICFILGFFAWNFAKQPAKLSRKVEEQSLELRTSNERYEMATKATSDVIWDWDLTSGKVYRTAQLTTLLGYAPGDQNNNDQFWRELIHPEDSENTQVDLKKTLEGTEDFWESEFRIKNQEGGYNYILDKGYIIRDKSGKAVRMIGATQDITRRKQAEIELKKEKDRLFYVIKGTNAGLWEWNIQTGETVYNDIWAELIGYSLAELQPVSIETWKEHTHPEDLKKANQELKLYFEGKQETYQTEIRMKHKKGHWVWMMDRGQVFSWSEDGKPLMMFGTHLDITATKTQEEQIHQANLKLESANKELKVFASLASHDMKEPLRMISSFMSLLKKKYAAELDDKANQYIDFAIDGSKRLTNLISDLLEYSKIGFDKSQAEPLDTQNIIQQVLELKSQLIEEKVAKITLGKLPQIRGIRVPIQLLFQNLIGNALKFSKPDVKPEIRIEGEEKEDHWEFSVADNGIGIEPDYIQQVFEILVKLHPKEQFPGTGMGLAICKKIVEQYGGTIRIESEIGKGSKFIFTLEKL